MPLTPRKARRALWPALVALAAAGAFLIARQQAQGPDEAVTPPAAGLPSTPDYHSLLVAREDASRLVLGTHVGLYESTDGGRSWAVAELEGQDAMNLARAGEAAVWAAGHDVLAKSENGGATWADVRPEGLPSLDLHGFASDPSDPSRLYAAVAGEGLYRSDDGGRSFALVSEGVGPGVFGLAVSPEGRILAADPSRALFASDDGGRTWRPVLEQQIVGVAVNPADPRLVLAIGAGIYLSRDGGETWAPAFPLAEGGGPVAWSPSDPDIAYVVGFDRILYSTSDSGVSWRAVGDGEG